MSIIKVPKILIPKENIDLEKWAVIACDQFTSQRDYWDKLDGFCGEVKLEDGAFVVSFYDNEQTNVVFPFSKFGQGQNAVKGARAKCGSFILFLEDKGLSVKSFENS